MVLLTGWNGSVTSKFFATVGCLDGCCYFQMYRFIINDFPWRLKPFVDSDLHSDFKCQDASHQAHGFQALTCQNHPLSDFELEGRPLLPASNLSSNILQTQIRPPHFLFGIINCLSTFFLVASDTSTHKKVPSPVNMNFTSMLFFF
jgi:hypothetical protein